MSEWQEIESAPKDGTPILACAAFQHGEYQAWGWPSTIVWAAYHPNAKGKECWRNSPVCGNKMEAVTHWMPLPGPPKIIVESA